MVKSNGGYRKVRKYNLRRTVTNPIKPLIEKKSVKKNTVKPKSILIKPKKSTKKVPLGRNNSISNIVTKKASTKKKEPPKKAKKTVDFKKASADDVAEMLENKKDLFSVRNITDDFVKGYTGRTLTYDKNQKKDMVNFFNTLRNNEDMKFLTELDTKGKEHFFKLTSYNCTEASKVIINKAMCLWANNMVKDKYAKLDLNKLKNKKFYEAQYEPNSMDTYDKRIWSAFRSNVSKISTLLFLILPMLTLIMSFFVGNTMVE